MSDIFAGNYITGDIAYARIDVTPGNLDGDLAIEEKVDELLSSIGYESCIWAFYPPDFERNFEDFARNLDLRMNARC